MKNWNDASDTCPLEETFSWLTETHKTYNHNRSITEKFLLKTSPFHPAVLSTRLPAQNIVAGFLVANQWFSALIWDTVATGVFDEVLVGNSIMIAISITDRGLGARVRQ